MPRSRATSSSDGEPARPGSPARAPDSNGAVHFTANGWRIALHPELLLQLEKLTAAVEEDRRRSRGKAGRSPAAQILANLCKLMLEDVPADPGRTVYRQGGTLGERRKHWFRAKFGNGRYRLFFRFRTRERIIVFAWVNDEKSLRTYGSSTDAYAVFGRRLDQGRPPDDWEQLLKESATAESMKRLERILGRFQP